MNYRILFLFLWLGWLILLFSCQRKYVCPAYQSAFVLDQEKTEDFFSLFGEDSLPKSDFFVNKNKYGIIVKVKFRKKREQMKTIKMKTVYAPPADSFLLADHNLEEMDSASIDSLFMTRSGKLNNYNRDQRLYLIAMEPFLNSNDTETSPAAPDNKDQVPAVKEDFETENTEVKKKKSWWPFGKSKNNESKTTIDSLSTNN